MDDLTKRRIEARTLAARQDSDAIAAETGYGVGITDVDCTPRPRFREMPEEFAQRMRGYGAEAKALQRSVNRDNRNAALRTVSGGEVLQYFTLCACGWCGLRVTDPEVARREYDAHPCTVNGEMRTKFDGPGDKRGPSAMVPALAEERAKLGIVLPGEVVEAAPIAKVTTADEDADIRAALLELK